MEIVRKLNYIFSREQKIKLALLFVMIVVGTFAELFWRDIYFADYSGRD